jgi:hypothetical protein
MSAMKRSENELPGLVPIERVSGSALLSALGWFLLLFLLAALPILLHGCHGDEDNELFAPLMRHFHNRELRQ